MATYVAELRAIAEFCSFRAALEVMLRDRIVCGTNDSAIQRCLLAELTFKQALDLATGLEAAAHDVKELKTPCGQEIDPPTEVCKVTSWNKADIICYQCGKLGHYAPKCRVSKDVTCHQCSNTGHLQRAYKRGKRVTKIGKLQSGAVRHVWWSKNWNRSGKQ